MAYNGSLGVANNQPDGQAGGRCGCPFFLLNCFLSKPQNITSVVGEFCRPLLNSENSEPLEHFKIFTFYIIEKIFFDIKNWRNLR